MVLCDTRYCLLTIYLHKRLPHASNLVNQVEFQSSINQNQVFMVTQSEKNTATFIHLSLLTKYFIPFGNYLFPIILWNLKKDKAAYIDQNAKQALNYQLSLLLYVVILIIVAIPCFFASILQNISFNTLITDNDFSITNLNLGGNTGFLITGIIALLIIVVIKITEFFFIIYAAVKTSNAENFNYPLTINFIK